MRFKTCSLPLLALLGTSPAMAFEFGEIRALSGIGQPFRAEVPLFEDANETRLGAECFSISPLDSANSGLPSLSQGRITLNREGGRVRLFIASEQRIDEPVVQFSVRVACGPLQYRSYTALMAPALAATSATRANGAEWISAEGESARAIAASIFPGNVSAQGRFLSALLGANPDIALGAKGEQRLAVGTVLRLPQSRHLPSAKQAKVEPPRLANTLANTNPPSPSRSHEHTSKTGPQRASKQHERSPTAGSSKSLGALNDPPALRLAVELAPLAPQPTSETQRSILRTEYKLISAIYEQANQQLNLAEQVRVLDTSLTALVAATESVSRATGQPLPPALPPILPTQATPPSAAANPVAAPVATPLETHKTPSPPPPENADDNDFGITDGLLELATEWWRESAALLGLIALALLWRSIKQKSLRQAPGPQKVVERDPLSIVEEDVRSALKGSQAPRDLSAASRAPAPSLVEHKPWSEPPMASPLAEDEHEFNPVMELAEIMLSFGRVKGAAQALQEYIEKSPNEALQPWMKLLEVYRQGDMREEFEGLSEKLKLHFNVAPADWASTVDLVPPPMTPIDEDTASIEQLLALMPNIAQFTRIREEITRKWDSQEGFDYLNGLLRDNRKGERQGFPLTTVNELLYLMAILEKRLKHRAP